MTDAAIERLSARVREQVDGELARARTDLADARRRLNKVRREHQRAARAEEQAWAKYEPHDGKPGGRDLPSYAKWQEASSAYERAGKALLGAYDRVRYLERLIESLSDPATVEARISKRVAIEPRFERLRERDRASTDTTPAGVGGRSAGITRSSDEGGIIMAKDATQTRRRGGKPQDEGKQDSGGASSSRSKVPQEIVDRIVTQVGDEGLGLSTVAKKLNEDNIPTPGTSKEWTPQYVRALYLKATGLKGVKQQRARVPLKRSAAAKAEEPAAAAS